MQNKYLLSDHPSPTIKGYPDQPVTPDTAYPGCRLHHVTGSLEAVVIGFDPEDRLIIEAKGDIVADWNPKMWSIARDNQPSPIGRDQCGVRRANGVIERVAMFDGADALLVYWGSTGGWRDPQWEPIAALGDRYTTVGTFAECKAWIKEQEKPKLRYAAESATADPCSSLICVLDRVAGGFLTASQVESYLNAADRKSEGGDK